MHNIKSYQTFARDGRFADLRLLLRTEAIKYQWHWEHYFGSVPLAFFTLTKAISGGTALRSTASGP
eukprot:6489647-Amphidinium_carterae.1